MASSNSPSTFPAYLNEEFFRKCLANGLGEHETKINDVKMTMGSGLGDNYTSFIYRAFINYSDSHGDSKSLSIIIKSIPTDGDRAFLEEIDVYAKEIDIYLKVLPLMHGILEESRVAPRCYFAVESPIRTIVFEDLREKGFYLAERQLGLNEDHCKVVLNKMAKFHASSMVALRKMPSIRERFKDGFFNKDAFESDIFQAFFRKNFKRGAEIVTEMPGYEHFAPKLMNIFDNFCTKAQESIAFKENNLVVLNHGDLWSNNIMFKDDKETGTPVDAIFVDYQMCYVNSLALDLNYFFVTSSQPYVLSRKKEFVEKFYYPAFEEVLKNVDFDSIPTLNEIFQEMEKRELFALFNLFGELPIMSLAKEDSITNNYAEFVDEEKASKARNAGMSTKRFIDMMQYALKYYEKLKVL